MLKFLVDAILSVIFLAGTALTTILGLALTHEAGVTQTPVIAFMTLFGVIIMGGATSHYYIQAQESLKLLRQHARIQR
jgi:uncharacterized membrane protein